MKKFIKLLSIIMIAFVLFSMKSSEMSKSEENGRTFWGTSCGEVWCLPNGQCYQTCCYYVFWMNTGCTQIPAGGNQ